MVCREKSDGYSQGSALAIAERRSRLSKPPGAPYDRRDTGADGCHPPSHQSLAEGLGAQSRARATAPSEHSQKNLSRRGLLAKSDTPRRAGGLMSRAASKAAGCHLPTQTASNRPSSSLVFWSRLYALTCSSAKPTVETA